MLNLIKLVRRAPLAQLVEQAALNRRVVGSSPTGCTVSFTETILTIGALLLACPGLLAQLVEYRPVTAEVAGSSPVQTARQPPIGVAAIQAVVSKSGQRKLSVKQSPFGFVGSNPTGGT